MTGEQKPSEQKPEEQKELTPEEKKVVGEYLGFGAPIPEEKHNVHSFLYKVATADDTTKLGNLEAEEIGDPSKTLRTHKEMALIATKIMDNIELGEYYEARGEIITSTSLSKKAKLINLSVVQKRIVDVSDDKAKKLNKGWFKKRKPEEPEL